MKEIIDFLNKNSGSIQTITTVALALLTGVYVYLTAKLLRTAREEHEAETRPYIQVTPYTRHSVLLAIVIKNIGKAPAENVKLTLGQDFYQYGKKNSNLRDYPLFKQVTKQILPNQEFHFDLAQSFLIFSDKPEESAMFPKTLSINAEYSHADKTFNETSVIDFYAYFNSREQENELVTQLEEINKSIEKLRK